MYHHPLLPFTGRRGLCCRIVYFMTSFYSAWLYAMTAPATKQLRAALRAQRDALLSHVAALLQRHLTQREFGQTTTWTEVEAVAVAQYAQALRDVPQQPHFPHLIAWPSVPAALAMTIIS